MRALLIIPVILFAGCAGERAGTTSFPKARLTPVLELRIGSVDDPELAFTWFRDLEVGPAGEIYTLHPMEMTIRVHDAEGRFVRTIGREGEGPGEFKNPGPMGLLGDTLLVLDFGTYRFSYFDLAGELLGSRRIPIELGRDLEERPPRPTGLFYDGSIRGAPPAWSQLVADGKITEQVALRLDTAGAVLDTIVVFPIAKTIWRVTDPKNPRAFASFRYQPFSDTELVEVSEYDPLIVRVSRPAATRAEPSSYSVTALTLAGDTIFAREFSYDPKPIELALVDSLVREFGASVSRSLVPGAATREQAEAWARNDLYLPAFHPPVSRMVIGRDGSIWLRGEALGEQRVEWRVLSPEGEPVGTVDLPARLRVIFVQGDRLWGSDSDELDVPYIVRYRLRRDSS
jgi:hypothetical protein